MTSDNGYRISTFFLQMVLCMPVTFFRRLKDFLPVTILYNALLFLTSLAIV
eukprot:CAMPEP_0116909938 /NCGR_PEP_ID=MMETSP0467-20121206/14578_1 /TAXON_ID=283647 /ORGANISM="Mesodinium pulex, Strain SPMC105" /LENGTH=50 /DNA_ID=CAMNT_0004585401 /DNA_START=645 /DNA_END=797 /DNA_ORIENTATION=+